MQTIQKTHCIQLSFNFDCKFCISSYSIPVRADTRTVEDQRQSILIGCVELENQYTTKAISEYTLLYNLRIITEIGNVFKTDRERDFSKL